MKKWVSVAVTIALLGYAGYYFLQNVLGNTDEMMTYLENTEQLSFDYFSLMNEELLLESEEELVEFTELTLIPGLEDILARSKEIGKMIEKDELKEVHELHNKAIERHLDAERAWVAQEESLHLYEESDALYIQFEEELDSLAKKWGVEIEWIEQEE